MGPVNIETDIAMKARKSAGKTEYPGIFFEGFESRAVVDIASWRELLCRNVPFCTFGRKNTPETLIRRTNAGIPCGAMV